MFMNFNNMYIVEGLSEIESSEKLKVYLPIFVMPHQLVLFEVNSDLYYFL